MIIREGDRMNILWGLVGMLTVMAVGVLISYNRKDIKAQTILGALTFQVGFAFITLKTEFGRNALLKMSAGVEKITESAYEGINFLFGDLTSGDGFIFAFEALGIIVFFSALIAVLYHLGVMQLLVDAIGGFLSKLLGTTKVESLSAAANIFLGHTEAPLVVKPYMKKITNSELFAIMVGGFASVSGSVLVGYSLMGIPLNYLLAASVMAAPAGLLMAKLVYPMPKEMDKEAEKALEAEIEAEEEENEEKIGIIEAAANGAAEGLQMALNIGGMLLAFIALIAVVNNLMGWVGGWFGYGDITLQSILGVIFSPLMIAIGVVPEEAIMAGGFIGQKIVINEFVAFSDFGAIVDQMSEKTVMILTFALCGFGNFGSIAGQIGGLGTLAPNRRSDVANMGLRAMITGSLASLLNATIAGMLL